MKYKIFVALSFWIILLSVSCNRDDISFDSPLQLLRFSRDTVFCDTVYNLVRSETYAVKVYNNEDNDIMIPKISLAGGSSSLYRINVDGKAGTEFSNVPLRKKDSLYIFVEIAPLANAPEAIAEDQVVFESPAGNQHVTLFSVVQDAEFFIESKTNPNIINSSAWTNEKAKIIFGNLTLAENQTLDIQAGTKVYFFKNSGMKISKNSKLNINGSLNSEVIFRGDRNDPKYDTIPKNWNKITFEEGSELKMNYGKIFGGTTGLDLYQSTATIDNSIIHTFQEYGIHAVNSKITATNLVMNNCGEANLGIFKGGNITLLHSTLANYWEFNSALPALGIYATNEWKNADDQTENAGLILNIRNSIVYGHAQDAIVLNPISGLTFNYDINYSLLKYSEKSTYNTTNSIIDKDPIFVNYYTEKMNLRVADDSPAKAKGIFVGAAATDIVGIARTNPPTIGAYQ